MRHPGIGGEKLAQAVGMLQEFDLGCWLLLGRETSTLNDPSLALVLDTSVTWQSAFVVGRGGERIAIVGRYDVANVESAGAFTEVIGYDADLGEPLRRVLSRLDPSSIGLNYSEHDHTCDGLTYGMYLALQRYLRGTPYAGRLVSADRLASALRGRKSPLELQHIQAAIGTTVEMFGRLSSEVRPGRSEREIQGVVHGWLAERGLDTAWDFGYCPTLNAGPLSPVGHTPAGETQVRPGDFFHIDFGIKQAGYCSDLQRVYYVARPDENAPPAELQRGFDTVVTAIAAAAATLQPGAVGHAVDAAARGVITAAGYPEFMHATGHQVGRTVHDGATVLGPRWPRYGSTVDARVEAGEIYTLELGVMTPGGICSLEEMVLVTATGCRFLTPPQTCPVIVRA